MPNGIDVLRSLGKDPAFDLLDLQDQRKRELQAQLFNAARTQGMTTSIGPNGAPLPGGARRADPNAGTPGELNALKGLLGGIEEDQASSPLARDVAVQDELDKAGAQQGFAAHQQGFENPQAQALYERQQDEAKLGMPLKVAEANSQGDIRRQEVANQGALDRQNAVTQSSLNFIQGLKGAGGQGPRLSGFNPTTGGLSFNYPSATSQNRGMNQASLTQVQKARDAFEQTKRQRSGFFGGAPDPNDPRVHQAQANLDQAISSAVLQHPANSDVKGWAGTILSDPSWKDVPFSEIQSLPDLQDADPQEINDLREILSIYRGKDF